MAASGQFMRFRVNDESAAWESAPNRKVQIHEGSAEAMKNPFFRENWCKPNMNR
jgi:hypothetical protein